MPASTYWTLDVELLPESEELWSLFCYRRGAGGAQWLEEQPRQVRIRYTFDALNPAEAARWPQEFQAAYPEAVPPERVAVREHPVEPWATQWREHFKPLPVGQRLLICPPWDRGEANPAWRDRKRIVIDPGQGFGTGQHASTALALELLEQALATTPLTAAVLDVGTGSGILALAACLLGVPAVCGIDLDARVMPEVRRNFSHSGAAVRPLLALGGPACIGRAFPLVLANLTAPVLLACATDLARLTLPGGALILSGILTAEHAEVRQRYEALGLRTVAVRDKDAWTGMLLNPDRR